jgi:hypothetical protein
MWVVLKPSLFVGGERMPKRSSGWRYCPYPHIKAPVSRLVVSIITWVRVRVRVRV